MTHVPPALHTTPLADRGDRAAHRSAALQASFFMMYVLTNGLFASALAFLRLPGALVYVLLRALSATAGQRKRQWSQQYMAYGDDVPQHTITFLLLLIFGVAQPLLAVVAALYFGVSYIYARYDLLYVQRETFQSGGLFWPVVRAPATPLTAPACCAARNKQAWGRGIRWSPHLALPC